MHRPTRSDLELEEDLAADTNEYFVNPAAAACYNQMVGQMVFQTTNQLVISMGSQAGKVGAAEAFTNFIAEGGLQHSLLEKAARIPYLEMDGSLKGINVRKGPCFRVTQLVLMREWRFFNLMLATNVRCDTAMIRVDSVHWLDPLQ